MDKPGNHTMKLLKMEKVREGKYLKNYELTYLNKAGREKTFEIVSRKNLASPGELGAKPSGVSIIAYQGNKMLLLKEFRMSINKSIFNLCAGMLEEGESIEQCIERELYEETGAISFALNQICVYSVTAPDNLNGEESFGMLYLADVDEFEPDLHSEIEKIVVMDTFPEKWTYPQIQPKLLEEARRRGFV